MKAEDTVMTEEQIKAALVEKGYIGDGLIVGPLAHQALEVQAASPSNPEKKKCLGKFDKHFVVRACRF